ncbi:hypothetical protein K402DRAFT_401879 [Aulographum hederae CBS 113979]|uniref:Uncharacterized protein n=1 Tax=Aulographum hederae CBS 113979 TaxID=1176131 RepID=A0A6G1H9V0_9PEZI|nr:hypothetical protein K402DRAFT_401879 [Aulographum hederae CBS 113979]
MVAPKSKRPYQPRVPRKKKNNKDSDGEHKPAPKSRASRKKDEGKAKGKKPKTFPRLWPNDVGLSANLDLTDPQNRYKVAVSWSGDMDDMVLYYMSGAKDMGREPPYDYIYQLREIYVGGEIADEPYHNGTTSWHFWSPEWEDVGDETEIEEEFLQTLRAKPPPDTKAKGKEKTAEKGKKKAKKQDSDEEEIEDLEDNDEEKEAFEVADDDDEESEEEAEEEQVGENDEEEEETEGIEIEDDLDEELADEFDFAPLPALKPRLTPRARASATPMPAPRSKLTRKAHAPKVAPQGEFETEEDESEDEEDPRRAPKRKRNNTVGQWTGIPNQARESEADDDGDSVMTED